MDAFSITAALRQMPHQTKHSVKKLKKHPAEVATFWTQREQKYSHHEHKDNAWFQASAGVNMTSFGILLSVDGQFSTDVSGQRSSCTAWPLEIRQVVSKRRNETSFCCS